MGLSIYFCDICGVRITDADLRSGHGMLQVYDAICGGCIELGHGKPWLESRQAVAKEPSEIQAQESPFTKDTVRIRTESQGEFGQAAVALGAMAATKPSKSPSPIDLNDPAEEVPHSEESIAETTLKKSGELDSVVSEETAKKSGKPTKD